MCRLLHHIAYCGASRCLLNKGTLFFPQGIAHLVEHVTFLGSKRRESLLGTGARANAYTDFHHTVFHVHAPLVNCLTGTPMLPQVWHAVVEVYQGVGGECRGWATGSSAVRWCCPAVAERISQQQQQQPGEKRSPPAVDDGMSPAVNRALCCRHHPDSGTS